MLARLSGLGVEMAVVVLGCVYLGQWLDKRKGLETPVFTLVLAFFGVIYVFYRIFKTTSR